MKRYLSLLIIVFLIGGRVATAEEITALKEFTVTAQRPMKEIGVNKTTFDSLALKENIALSMADVLTFNSGVFVKNHGRATLSTVAFRGTSPSHTQVSWNGIRINSPMLGMTDFSTIPAYFIDRAALLHGTSSVNETGGGLGGLVKLSTIPDAPPGFNLQYIQGIGSFSTFDEFLRATFHNNHFTTSTRIVYSSSPNDYPYINHDKKENEYDDDHNIIGQYHPRERNRSGAYKDFHVLQEAYYNTLKGDRLGLNAWWTFSDRELPMLTTDYGDEKDFENKQKENTFRGVISWDHNRNQWNMGIKAGYVHTHMAYDYRREIAEDLWATMTRSRSDINTIFASAEWNYTIADKWYFTASASVHQHFVKSKDKNIILVQGNQGIVGYEKARLELSFSLSAKWQPISSLGLGLTLREDLFGDKNSPVIPALFADYQPLRAVWNDMPVNLMLKGSMSTNYRFPTLNDLYFLPGGNPDLKSEHGITYDLGVSFNLTKSNLLYFSISANWFDSNIDNWIIWLPTTKGFFSPRNVKKVHAYGIESNAHIDFQLPKGWNLDLSGAFSWTPSINKGDKYSPGDRSVGKQLPYVPKFSSSFTGRVSWKNWAFLYKWCWYSERYTMSSNDYTLTGHLPQYFMSNVSIEKNLFFKPLDLQFKLCVNNLFNEDYLSVLSRPMPGINFEFFIGITPKFFNKTTTRKGNGQ